jgi:hypothetical protein
MKPKPGELGPKYPIKVHVSGDGNIFAIIGRVANAMRKAGVSDIEIKVFRAEAIGAHSYDAVLQVCLRWVDCD